jgi:hypothetical protein
VSQNNANFGIGTLEHVPPQLNRGDSHEAKDRRVYRH